MVRKCVSCDSMFVPCVLSVCACVVGVRLGVRCVYDAFVGRVCVVRVMRACGAGVFVHA
jgi:hypothetical protein